MKTHLSISILRDKSEMKDDWGIQDITTKYFLLKCILLLLLFPLLWLRRGFTNKKINRLCFHNPKVLSSRTKTFNQRLWDYNFCLNSFRLLSSVERFYLRIQNPVKRQWKCHFGNIKKNIWYSPLLFQMLKPFKDLSSSVTSKLNSIESILIQGHRSPSSPECLCSLP